MPTRPERLRLFRPMVEALEDRLPLTRVGSLTLAFPDPGPRSPGQASVASPLGPTAHPKDLDPASDGPSASSLPRPPALAAPATSTSAKGSTKVPSSTTMGTGYVYYRYGGQADVPLPQGQTLPGGVALEGGGTDIDLLYQWMGARADGVDATVSNNTLVLPPPPPPPAPPTPQRDFLVLRTTGTDAYDSYIYNLNKAAGTTLNSVSTLIITSSDATTNSTSKDFILDKINNAEAIFIAGGDQSTYVNLWQNTPIEDAINDAVTTRHVPIGGTSAGLAVLGQYVYSAENASAVSSTVLANPYDSSITLDQGFLSLPYLQNTITDSHFYERDRMGRLVTFLARLVTDPQWTPPSSGPPPYRGDPHTPLPGTMGIGIDQSTALLIDTAGATAGDATVIGNSRSNHLYFLETSDTRPTVKPDSTNTLAAPLTWVGTESEPAIRVHRATVGDTFDFNTLTWSGGTNSKLSADYQLSAMNGVLTSTQSKGSIY